MISERIIGRINKTRWTDCRADSQSGRTSDWRRRSYAGKVSCRTEASFLSCSSRACCAAVLIVAVPAVSSPARAENYDRTGVEAGERAGSKLGGA